MPRLGSFPFVSDRRQLRSRLGETNRISLHGDSAAASSRLKATLQGRCRDDLGWPVEPAISWLPIPTGAHSSSEGRPSATAGSAYPSVGAGVGRGVGRVVRAIEAIVDFAVKETMASGAEVLVAGVRHETCANTTGGDTCAKSSNATAAKATDVSATKAAHVASAKAATHTAAAVATATATAASGLCTRCKKAPCKQCACQYH